MNDERWLICGPRDYGVVLPHFTEEQIRKAWEQRTGLAIELDRLVQQRMARPIVITGGAPGTDTLADEWRKSRGFAGQVFKADWDAQPRRAGIIRNTQMLTVLRVIKVAKKVVIHFPPNPISPGTVNMREQALAAEGVEVIGLGSL